MRALACAQRCRPAALALSSVLGKVPALQGAFFGTSPLVWEPASWQRVHTLLLDRALAFAADAGELPLPSID